MSNLNKQGNREFVEHWRRVGKQLDQIRRDELRHYSHEENVAVIDSLLEIGVQRATFRPTSGLVEQQRLFMKARQ